MHLLTTPHQAKSLSLHRTLPPAYISNFLSQTVMDPRWAKFAAPVCRLPINSSHQDMGEGSGLCHHFPLMLCWQLPTPLHLSQSWDEPFSVLNLMPDKISWNFSKLILLTKHKTPCSPAIWLNKNRKELSNDPCSDEYKSRREKMPNLTHWWINAILSHHTLCHFHLWEEQRVKHRKNPSAGQDGGTQALLHFTGGHSYTSPVEV